MTAMKTDHKQQRVVLAKTREKEDNAFFGAFPQMSQLVFRQPFFYSMVASFG
jgi:hypothetical protein